MLTKKAHLKILDFTIPLMWGQQYHDDGYVSNLAEYAVRKRFGTAKPTAPEIRRAWIKRYNQDYQELSGITITLEKKRWLWDEKETHIAYLHFGDDLANLYIRGRQETEALQELGHLKTLEDIIKARYGLSFSGVRSEKVVDIGGAYALLKKQYKSREIAEYTPRSMNNRMVRRMRMALYDLTQASLISSHKKRPKC